MSNDRESLSDTFQKWVDSLPKGVVDPALAALSEDVQESMDDVSAAVARQIAVMYKETENALMEAGYNVDRAQEIALAVASGLPREARKIVSDHVEIEFSFDPLEREKDTLDDED